MNCRMPVCAPSTQSGLSLVELLLALAIGAAVMVPLLDLVKTAAATSSHAGPRFALQREAAFALQRVASAVRRGVPAASFTYSDGKLIETNEAGQHTLAGSVTHFVLALPAEYAGQQLVQVSLKLERDGATTTASATVRTGGVR